MTPTTIKICKSAFEGDPTIPVKARAKLVAMLRGWNDGPAPEEKQAIPRVLRRLEAAAMLGRTARFVDHLAQQGVLRKVRLPGRKLAIGFLAADVESLILEKCEEVA